MTAIKLTSYSHGAGCGCKISPKILDQILSSNFAFPIDDKLLVGNNSKDDAAVLEIGGGKALISTTDFFMPIVDDPYDFGRIASVNAISDVYAMGGDPILAIAILGWPIDKLHPEIASEVIRGARSACADAGITLAGGHSIDSPEPIFGLSVNGMVDIENLKRNSTAKEGDYLFLTKPLGVGILTTAQKKGLIKEEDLQIAKSSMSLLNQIGSEFGKIVGVNAMTDVTGFGLLGHLIEMGEGSGLSAEIYKSSIKLLTPNLTEYLNQQSIPGGTLRNIHSYGDKVELSEIDNTSLMIMADPQTSGGLLVSVAEEYVSTVTDLIEKYNIGIHKEPIGRMIRQKEKIIYINQ
jgi:selenide,water dikinase